MESSWTMFTQVLEASRPTRPQDRQDILPPVCDSCNLAMSIREKSVSCWWKHGEVFLSLTHQGHAIAFMGQHIGKQVLQSNSCAKWAFHADWWLEFSEHREADYLVSKKLF